jgi:hypothetical protein
VIALHVLLFGVWVLVAAVDRLGVRARTVSRLARAWLVAALVLASVLALRPDAWSRVPGASWVAHESATVAHTAPATALASAAAQSPAIPWHLLLYLGAAAGSFRLAAGLVGLGRELRAGVVLRRIGRVEVRSSERSAAVALPGKAVILLDPRTNSSIALRHEAVHHRHGDTAWAWLWALVEAAAWPDPLVAALVRRVRTLEEIACDAEVVRSIEPRIYAESLLHAAACMPPRAAFLPVAAFPHEIHRRLSVLAHPPSRSLPLLPAFLLGFGLLAGVAVAASGPSATTDALAKIQSSDQARAFYRSGLENRPAWSALVDKSLAEAGLPAWYAAIPLVESGYTNLGAPGDSGDALSRAPGIPGRGLWMCIPSTARSYGLAVDGATDERLDPTRETAAAVALLTDLHDEFGDWYLALAAYNQGAVAVRGAIAHAGTRDVWALVAAGELNNYVPEVAAAAEILEHPDYVR